MTTTFDVPQPIEEAWAFSADPSAQKEWDRSVADVEVTSPAPFGLGSTFRTIGPVRRGRPGLVTSYRVAVFEPRDHARIEVVDSPTLRRAEWDFRFAEHDGGTRIRWSIDLVARRRFPLLALALRLNRHQLVRDTRWFRIAMDARYPR